MADATAPPMPLAAMCCMSILSGKTSETPASAVAPSQPTKKASAVTITLMAMRFRRSVPRA